MDKKSNEGNNWGVNLVEFSVVLRAQNDPSLLNPEFLLYHNIVDPPRQILGGRITSPTISQAIFGGGLSVKADPQRIIFEQGQHPLKREEIVCHTIAKRYIEKVPKLPCTAVGINPKGLWVAPADRELHSYDLVANTLLGEIGQLTHRHVTPRVELKLIYPRNNLTIFLDIVEVKKHDRGSEIESPALLFTANFHRDLRQSTQQAKMDKIASILSSWQKNLEEFYKLVNTLVARSA